MALLPVANFWRHSDSLDGLQTYCKECCLNVMREYRKTPRSKAYVKSYNQRPEVLRLKQEYERSEIGREQKKKYQSRPDVAERMRSYRKRNKLRSRHGLTVEQYQSELKNRNGKCDGCDTVITGKICVDHCHNSNSFRGILCHACNVSLGLCLDSAEILRKLADYAERFSLLSGRI